MRSRIERNMWSGFHAIRFDRTHVAVVPDFRPHVSRAERWASGGAKQAQSSDSGLLSEYNYGASRYQLVCL